MNLRRNVATKVSRIAVDDIGIGRLTFCTTGLPKKA